MGQWRCGIPELRWSAKQDVVHWHLARSWSTRVRVSLESEPSVRLPTRIKADSIFESDSSVLKQMEVIVWSSSFRFHRVSWPNGDMTADSRSKQSKRSSKRSLHERKGDWIDWNTPVIRSFDGGGPTIQIFQASTRSDDVSVVIVAADAEQVVWLFRNVDSLMSIREKKVQSCLGRGTSCPT